MNIKRMEKLAAHLETVPPKGFDMHTWISGGTELKELKKANENKYKCGMAACVGGHACLVFPRLLNISEGAITLRKPEKNNYGVTYFIYDTDAIEKVLGLCPNHAYELTRAHAKHDTPKKAAKFIRNLIKENPGCCSNSLKVRLKYNQLMNQPVVEGDF